MEPGIRDFYSAGLAAPTGALSKMMGRPFLPLPIITTFALGLLATSCAASSHALADPDRWHSFHDPTRGETKGQPSQPTSKWCVSKSVNNPSCSVIEFEASAAIITSSWSWNTFVLCGKWSMVWCVDGIA